MPSARGQAYAVIDARLTPLAQEYDRMPSGDPSAFPALHVIDEGQDPAETESGADRDTISFRLEGFVEAAGGAEAHDQLNDLHAAAVAAIMAEPPLGGLAELITKGAMRVDTAQLASKRRLAFAQDFEIQVATVRGDPGQFA